MMQRFLRMAAVVAAAGVLAGLASSAGAATFTDSLTGVEVAFTSSQGTFTGVATGGLPGGWLAVVDHTKLSPNATITAGSFTLATVFNGLPGTLSGRFADRGSVKLINPGLNCTNQKFTVAESLTGVSGGR